MLPDELPSPTQYPTLTTEHRQLLQWVADTLRGPQLLLVSSALRGYRHDPYLHTRIYRFLLLSPTYEYHILLSKTNDGTPVYVSATYTCRIPRPGESWRRGGDLTDGDFSEATWQRIVNDIARTELDSPLASGSIETYA